MEGHQSLQLHQRTEQGTDGGVSGALIGGVNEVFAFIKNNPGCRANGIASTLNIPLRSIQRYLGQLKDENKVEFNGAPKTGGYYICGDNQNII